MNVKTTKQSVSKAKSTNVTHEITSEERIVELIESKIEMRSAPIPTVEEMAGYEKVMTGFADRILKMAEENQSANIKYQQDVLMYQARDVNTEQTNVYKITRLVVILGFLIVLTFIVGGFHLILKGHTYIGIFASFGGILGVLSIFLKILVNYNKTKNTRN